MNLYLLFVLIVLIGSFLLGLIVDNLNLKRLTTEVPAEFEGYYNAELYAKSQQYLRDYTRFGFWSESVNLVILLAFILFGGFDWLDRIARSLGHGEILSGLIFATILSCAGSIIALPFQIYSTFVIEERYGFNRTTPTTFMLDNVKGLLLSLCYSLPLLAAAIWFFNRFGASGWLYLWGAVTIYRLFIFYISPVVIMPLFNKFVPLEDGDLKSAVEEYVHRHDFQVKGVYKIDGSRRSSKANAYFTGFGRFRRIVLYDTLIQQHTVTELVAVLAHEVGHYKLGHVSRRMILGILNVGLMLFLLSFFVHSRGLADAFGMQQISVYSGLIFFSFLYAPISLLLSIGLNASARRDEYQADAIAAKTTGNPLAMIEALKKMSVHHLANLTPHPAKVALEYSHPPVLERIAALRTVNSRGGPK